MAGKALTSFKEPRGGAGRGWEGGNRGWLGPRLENAGKVDRAEGGEDRAGERI